MSRPAAPAGAGLTVDGTGLLCVTLLLRLRRAIDGAAAGTVVHVVATDPAAPLDLPVWCHMTGHLYLGPVPGTDRAVYALRLAADAYPTHPEAPWRRAGDVQGGAHVPSPPPGDARNPLACSMAYPISYLSVVAVGARGRPVTV
ncbi:sulfurtransferase TusA family protein [Streptomyces sp. NPDC096132]|uniref:sulfurtransferase TusA family protein n=1 Tax=Streptomyces sp. NPDC096132 TaxID=3366075 RepID=UPI0037FD92EE